jgi:hypothetical protein
VRSLRLLQVLVDAKQPLPVQHDPCLDTIILTELVLAVGDDARRKHPAVALTVAANKDGGWNLAAIEPFSHNGKLLKLGGVTTTQCTDATFTEALIWLEELIAVEDTLPMLSSTSDSGTGAAEVLSGALPCKRRAAATVAENDIRAVTHYQTHTKAEPPVLAALGNKKFRTDVSSVGQELASVQRGTSANTETGGTAAAEVGASLSTVDTSALEAAVPPRARAGRKPKAQQPPWYHQRLFLAGHLMDGLTATLTQLSAKYGRHVGMSRRAGRVLSKANGLNTLADYAAVINKMPKRKGKSKMTVWRERAAAARGHATGGASLTSTAAAPKTKGKLATTSGRGGRSKKVASSAADSGSSVDRGVDGTADTTSPVVEVFRRTSKRSLAAADSSWGKAIVTGAAAAGGCGRAKRHKARPAPASPVYEPGISMDTETGPATIADTATLAAEDVPAPVTAVEGGSEADKHGTREIDMLTVASEIATQSPEATSTASSSATTAAAATAGAVKSMTMARSSSKAHAATADAATTALLVLGNTVTTTTVASQSAPAAVSAVAAVDALTQSSSSVLATRPDRTCKQRARLAAEAFEVVAPTEEAAAVVSSSLTAAAAPAVVRAASSRKPKPKPKARGKGKGKARATAAACAAAAVSQGSVCIAPGVWQDDEFTIEEVDLDEIVSVPTAVEVKEEPVLSYQQTQSYDYSTDDEYTIEM